MNQEYKKLSFYFQVNSSDPLLPHFECMMG